MGRFIVNPNTGAGTAIEWQNGVKFYKGATPGAPQPPPAGGPPPAPGTPQPPAPGGPPQEVDISGKWQSVVGNDTTVYQITQNQNLFDWIIVGNGGLGTGEIDGTAVTMTMQIGGLQTKKHGTLKVDPKTNKATEIYWMTTNETFTRFP